MTLDEMIRMAHEAGWKYADGDSGYEPLWTFAALVAAPLEERIQLLYKQLDEAEKQLDAQYQMGVEAEREACAKLFDAYLLTSDPGPLRARGNNA